MFSRPVFRGPRARPIPQPSPPERSFLGVSDLLFLSFRFTARRRRNQVLPPQPASGLDTNTDHEPRPTARTREDEVARLQERSAECAAGAVVTQRYPSLFSSPALHSPPFLTSDHPPAISPSSVGSVAGDVPVKRTGGPARIRRLATLQPGDHNFGVYIHNIRWGPRSWS